MNIAALHNLIREAQEHEARTGRLGHYIHANLDQVHQAIALPEQNPDEALLNFISNYVNQVPHLLQAAHEVAEGAGISPWIKPVLKITEQFFLQPPKLIDGREGLEMLVSAAYLALRMVEEVNDRYIFHLGKPLIPLDLTVANLVVHHLIGEPFSNQLDSAVEHAVSALLPENTFDQDSVQTYRKHLHAPNVLTAWLSWPCFSRQWGIELALAENTSEPRPQAEPISPADNAPEASPSVTVHPRSRGTHPSRRHKP